MKRVARLVCYLALLVCIAVFLNGCATNVSYQFASNRVADSTNVPYAEGYITITMENNNGANQDSYFDLSGYDAAVSAFKVKDGCRFTLVPASGENVYVDAADVQIKNVTVTPGSEGVATCDIVLHYTGLQANMTYTIEENDMALTTDKAVIIQYYQDGLDSTVTEEKSISGSILQAGLDTFSTGLTPTGDTTPVMLLGVLLLMSAGCVVLLRKQKVHA